MKVKARIKQDMVLVRVLIKHPMEPGSRKDEATGELVPAKYVREFTCRHKEKIIITAHFGPAVSKNPYVSFSFAGGHKGEQLSLRWVDNTGESKNVETVIK